MGADVPQFDDKVWQKLRRKIGALSKAQVHVGVLASMGGDQVHDPESGLTLIEIAAIHEFGSPAAGVPERSFIRATAELAKAELVTLQTRIARAILADRMTVPQALGFLGAWLQVKIKQRMTSGAGIPPPLAPSTLEARERRQKNQPPETPETRHKPLIDTGRLYNSIQWQVVANGGL